MSQSNHENGLTATGNTALELAVRVAPSPANDVTSLPQLQRSGPLGLPRIYWALWAGMLINRLGGMVFMLLGIYLTRERHLAPELAGLVVGLNAAGGLFAGPVGGALSDRIGRRATLLAGTAFSGLLMLALGSARSIATLVAIAPLLGFFTDLCRPPLQAAVADVVAPADRKRAYGLLYWAINLGFAGAAVVGGALADRHFFLVFVVDAVTTLGFGAIVLVGVPETRPGLVPPGAAAAGGGARRLIAPFRNRRFMPFVAIQLLMLLAFAQVILALPLDMRAHGLATTQIGWLLGLHGVCIVIAQPIALRYLRRLSNVHWLAAGAALTGVGLGVTAFAGGAPVYAAAVLLWTLGEIGFSTAAPTVVAELAPADQRGAYQGTYQLAWGIANTSAPAIGSLVLARLGSTSLWVGCLAVCLAAAGLHLRTNRWRGGGRS